MYLCISKTMLPLQFVQSFIQFIRDDACFYSQIHLWCTKKTGETGVFAADSKQTVELQMWNSPAGWEGCHFLSEIWIFVRTWVENLIFERIVHWADHRHIMMTKGAPPLPAPLYSLTHTGCSTRIVSMLKQQSELFMDHFYKLGR